MNILIHMKKIILPAILVFSLILSGCSINIGSNKTTTKADGGVFKSITKGSNWIQKPAIPSNTGKPGSIADRGSTTMVIDPSDNKAIYFGSTEGGMYYSYDAAENWFPVKAIGDALIKGIAIDPSNKCILYAATANRLLKTVDCSRTWQQTYFDNDLTVGVTTVAVDSYDSKIVYIGTSRGEIIQSTDSGKSWRVLNRFDNDLRKIQLGPTDSRLIFVATESKGLFRSVDRGVTWESLQDKLKDFKDNRRFRDLFLSSTQPGFMILATKYGLLKSINNGDDWVALELITPESEATINSVITNPTNPQEMYYVTNTTFYGSVDGGIKWASKKLPTSRGGNILLSDPKEPTVLYLSTNALKK